MKELKFNRAATIVLIIMGVIAIGGLVTVAILPNSYFDGNGDPEEGLIGKIFLCCLLGLVAIVTLVCGFIGTNKEKKKIEYLNQLRAYLGDTALFFNGKKLDPRQAKSDAKKNAASIAGGVVMTAILGIGFYKIHHTNTARTFIVHDNGICAVDRQTMESANLSIEDLRNINVTLNKKGNVLIKFPNRDYHFVLYTKRTDVNAEWLQTRLIELSNKPVQVDESPFDEEDADCDI